MIGLTFDDRMRGSWHRLESPGEERPIAFHARATIPALHQLLGNAVARLEGRMTVDGLAHDVPFTGTLGVGALVRERRVPYAFFFQGDDGRTYRFDGTKEVSLLDLSRTMSTLPAYLFDDTGAEIGRAVLHFDVRGDFVRFLRSWKPVRAE